MDILDWLLIHKNHDITRMLYTSNIIKNERTFLLSSYIKYFFDRVKVLMIMAKAMLLGPISFGLYKKKKKLKIMIWLPGLI